jgi:hypothetical protein
MIEMRSILSVPALVGALALGACAVAPPSGPSIAAWPGNGKDFAAFQADDTACQDFAQRSIGGQAPGDAATSSAVSSALVGTLIGAGAGAGIGAAAGNPLLGAAAGAGAGLLFGSAAGLNASAASGASLQRRYDMRYAQCMYSKGDQVPGTQSAAIAAPVVATGPIVTPVFTQVSPANAKAESAKPANGAPVTVTPLVPAK